MTNAVMLSVQPRWCELIASGKKTIEIRKTRPKIEPPFKCYIYCTAPRKFQMISKHMATSNEYLHLSGGKVTMSDGFEFFGREDYQVLNGKVIGEFVCDRLSHYIGDYSSHKYLPEFAETAGLTSDELLAYTEGKPFYGWHISNLAIYDEPKEISNFASGSSRLGYNTKTEDGFPWVWQGMTRAPQSWQYVEELNNE